MIFDKYLNDTYLDILYSNYNLDYLKSIDSNNFIEIYNLLKSKGFYFIEDIIINYENGYLTIKATKTVNLKVSKFTTKETKKKIVWKSSNRKIATVYKDGKVVAKKPGKVVITAMMKSNKKIYSKCKITIYKVDSNGYKLFYDSNGKLLDGRTNYNLGDYTQLLLKIPSLPEQQKIGSYFQNLDNLISKQSAELEKLKNVKKTLLSKMFV